MASRFRSRFDGLPRRRLAAHADAPVATTLRARLLGLALLDRRDAPAALLIPRCAVVHTFAMRFPLDLLFLDDGGRVLRACRGVPPRRLRRCAGAAAVLELPCGGETRPPGP